MRNEIETKRNQQQRNENEIKRNQRNQPLSDTLLNFARTGVFISEL
jgi:hypothetical protein